MQSPESLGKLLGPQVLHELEEYGLKFEAMACDPALADTAAFCETYGFKLEESANTIVVASRKVEPTKYAACVVLADSRLDVNKKVCELLGVKKASFADGETTQKLTSMQIGGVTAIGITDLPIYIDARVMQQAKIVMGGGNRSSKVVLDPAELTKLPHAEVIAGLTQPKPAV
jgi:prolyl-tRNA editing enzyme YbaK/EbsC (Cys-tRNA(Pro) deacylase)